MPLPPAVAEAGQAYADDQATLAEAAARISDQIGRTRLNGDPVQWRDAVAGQAEQLLALQQAAVELVDPFLNAVLDAQDVDSDGDGAINPAAFVDQTDGGGSWMRNLVYAPPSAYRDAIAVGAGDSLARARALYVANSIVTSAMQDIPRAAVTTGMLARRRVKGYVRVLRGRSCARCAILAGRRYFVSAFRRHPNCDCYHVPVAEDANGWETNPKAYFRSLSRAEQDEIFGEGGAEAIRLGADMNQVVNAQQGTSYTISAFGRDIEATTYGTSTRGLYGGYIVQPDGTLVRRPTSETERRASGDRSLRFATAPRLMPDEIFLLAEQEGWSREQTLGVLRRFAYLV